MLKLKQGLIRLLIFSLSGLPFFILYLLSDLLYFVLHYIVRYRKKVITENLKNSFPEKSEAEIFNIRKQFYKNMADLVVESLKLFTISDKELSKRLEYDNPEHITQWIEAKRSVMIASGHFGNWEYPSGFPLKLPGFNQYDIIYSTIKDPYINELVLKSRSRHGCHMISMKNTFREILKHDNFGHLYGFIFDQSPARSLIRYDLEFLNQTTPVHLGTEQVAVKKNAVVVYFEVYKVKRGYYRVKTDIVTTDPGKLKKYELTHILFEKLEESIKANPANWLWSHKRWKYKAGVHYNIKK